ncbi:MAG: type II toxin-antitoxin system HipA family toxin [Bacteroidetes bacterium]|nr:type II toxin-antitoxin system HipA family toxin [Bacteroidota bacterium]
MASKESKKQIYVFADWKEFDKPELLGTLNVILSKGKEIFSFEYDKEWLKSGRSQTLDPDLQLFSGPQYLRDEKDNFGVFLDSSPDRWGRVLMIRCEAALAKLEKREQKTLLESDFLLGVYDGHRMGALRFKENNEGPFLNDNKEMSAPPWADIRYLEYASLQLEKDNISKDPRYMKWLNLLIAPGSSLGGARPKASVLDEKKHLWIAKFPSTKDEVDKGLWEMITNDLASKSGINTASGIVKKFSVNGHTYLTKRFDRDENGKRIHFASAMTMLGYTDHVDGVSYLELADFLIRNGSNTTADLEEIWKRIVFNICVKNTDDHLRNHGFLLTPTGWTLSPAYDVNPNPKGTGLKLNISETDNSLDLDLSLSVANYFRIKSGRAKEIIFSIKKEIKNWNSFAKKYKAAKKEQEYMSQSFLCD